MARLGAQKRWASFLRVQLFLVVGIAAGVVPQTARAWLASEHNSSSRRVLVLYSDNRLLRANVVFDAGLRQALSLHHGESIECYSEFLDEVRFPAQHQTRTIDFLVAKYSESPPDVIVAFAAPSLDFCLRFRAQLFPNAPLVFAAIDVDTFFQPQGETRITGVRSRFDGPGTLRAALQLHPQAQRVFVVADSTVLDDAHPPMGWSNLRAADFDAEFQYLVDLPTQELLDRLQHLPEHSVVIYLSTFGGQGSNIAPAHVLAERMARVSRAPIYAALDAFVGHGVVGAVTTPTDAMARTTADLVVEALARDADQAMPPVRTLEATPVFDWRQLQRWGVREKQLPPGSIVLFAPPSLWQQHGKWVAATIAVFLVQSGLILALVLQSIRRRRAERDALRRRQELAHTTRVATVGELTASLAHEINQPLAAILSNAQAAQRLLAAGSTNGAEIRAILDDIAADDQRAGEVIRRMRALLRKEESEPSNLDVNELVSDVADLVHGEMILQSVTLELALRPDALWVSADRIQLQQVLLNLIMNSLDAMKEQSSGDRKLEIRTTSEGRSVRVAVTDTGSGIPEDSIERIFDRFVTTKPHGMGLGLAICTSIVEAHGGRVGGENNPERGATFWFEVPALEKAKA